MALITITNYQIIDSDLFHYKGCFGRSNQVSHPYYKNFSSTAAIYIGELPLRSFKRRHRQSFRIPQHWSITPDAMLKLPKMLPPIKMVQHREMEGTPSSVTISKTPTGKYYASVLVEYDQKDAPMNGGHIGADLGLKDFLITSEGRRYPNPRFYKRASKRLKRLQRSLSRKVKGSNNRNKQRLLVALAHEKVANQRRDMQHKELPESTPKEPVERQGYQGGYSLGLGSS